MTGLKRLLSDPLPYRHSGKPGTQSCPRHEQIVRGLCDSVGWQFSNVLIAHRDNCFYVLSYRKSTPFYRKRFQEQVRSSAANKRSTGGGFGMPAALIERKRCTIQDCFGETPKPTRSPQRIRPVADETPAHRRASCVLPYGFGGAAGFAASPGFGGAPPADAAPPGISSSGAARISCSTNDSG